MQVAVYICNRTVVFNLGAVDHLTVARAKGSAKVLKVLLKIVQFIEVPVLMYFKKQCFSERNKHMKEVPVV